MSDEANSHDAPTSVRILANNSARAERRRRTANLPTGTRTGSFQVRVSAEEKAEIERLAADHGVTPPRLMREAVLADEIPVSPDEFRELVHQLFRAQSALRALGNNLNQIARSVNATHELDEAERDQLAHVLASVRGYADNINHAVDRVVSW
ncbi:plasmid mobilization relaxosome protein MobC [Nocardia sp. NPDC058518]|uniref:plasmid mobilization protein n=1 Tax=Nocardia sp. NPDC058518 TaxID=3346534 RepID=UPI00365C07B0